MNLEDLANLGIVEGTMRIDNFFDGTDIHSS
jgi:hypothetical protein